MKHLFVINPRSFKTEAERKVVEREIANCFAKASDFCIHISRYPRDAVGIVSRYAAQSSDGLRVYAVGGDGILFDCLNGVIGYPETELAAIPYGGTNDYARAIGEGDVKKFMPIKPMLTAPSLYTDVIHCGSDYYLNFCAVGIESAAINKWYRMQTGFLKSRNKDVLCWLLTLSGVISVLNKKLVNQFYEVDIDGQKYDGNYAVVNFSNGPCYGGDKSVCPDAVFDDGIIDVLLVKSAGRLKLMTLIPNYLNGKYYKYPDNITRVPAKNISIRSEQPLYVNLDGECFLDTNISLRILPAAVRMIAAGGSSYRGA